MLAAVCLGCAAVRATTIIGLWEPIFKGVDHSVSTNLPSAGGMPHRLVVHTVRVDLTDPDIRLFATPGLTNGAVGGSREVGGLTTSDFLTEYKLQVAINANLFDAREYYLPAWTPMGVDGLLVSEGKLVSSQDSSDNAAAVVFDQGNHPRVIAKNWPSIGLSDVYTAVSGSYAILSGGVNIARGFENLSGFIHAANPRTAFGISADKRYLYLMTIDGRQPGYSEGALDYETAEWLLLMGASDGVNMDGGGSSLTVMENSLGQPVRLNASSAVADSGNERTVGAHFGVYAKPLVGFINDLAVVAEDTGARVTWTTVEPSDSQVEYGVTQDLGSSTAVDVSQSTSHAVQLTGLTPNNTYYFKAVSANASGRHESVPKVFTTIRHITTNHVFDLTHAWKYTQSNLNGVGWTSLAYDDAGWSGPGEGLLWVDTRATGPNPNVSPRGAQLNTDPANAGFPYRTYYFRTHFQSANSAGGVSMRLSCLIDDGAVFYLNGVEIYRLRMPEGTVRNDTLASGFPCSGDATCLDEFEIPAGALTSLKAGDNVIAVEVHNYNARSADMTFGAGLDLLEPAVVVQPPTLKLSTAGAGLVLSWAGTGFILQSADDPVGPWKDVSPAAQTGYPITPNATRQYYRLRR